MMVTSIRHLCYLLFSTYLLTIIKLIQLSLIMIIWWHSLGSLWIPPSTSKSGFQIRDYRASFYYRWPALKQWASSFFVDLKLFYSSTNKQKTWLSLITTYAMRENSLYSEIPFSLGGISKSAADTTCPFAELPWMLIFVFLPKNIPPKDGQLPDAECHRERLTLPTNPAPSAKNTPGNSLWSHAYLFWTVTLPWPWPHSWAQQLTGRRLLRKDSRDKSSF